MTTANDDKTLHSPEFSDEAPAREEPEPASQRVSRGPTTTFLSTDRFIERELIGQGGMGWVIRAFDRNLQRDVAIKVLSPEAEANETDVARLVHEARVGGRLEHPHILPVYEFGTDDRGTHYLCMKLVDGETLEDTLNWAGSARLEPDFLSDLLSVFVKVCEAVAFAHSRGVLHRDLKPANVMISDFGQVYVLDWGVARPTPRFEIAEFDASPDLPSDPYGLFIGTPRYMSPEQLHGLHDQLDERTDVFALGATLYQILTGRPPHDLESLPDIAMRRSRVSVVPPADVVSTKLVPFELSRIALKAMAHDPEDRYQSVGELKGDVERFLRSTWHLPRKWFAAGSVVITEGEPGDAAYIIVDGRCVAFTTESDAEVVLREMGPGDVFGETAVVSNKPRTASVRALGDLLVMIVTPDALANALGLNRWMGRFVKALADRFREVDGRVRQLERCRRSGGAGQTGDGNGL
jgi:serine/threonine-protein kinase